MIIQGTSCVVTGGASGLGAGVARALAGAGARVAVLDVNSKLATALASEIGAFAITCDVTSERAVADALAAARQKHGVVRILINCAGIGQSTRICGKHGVLALEDFERVIKVNLIGTFNALRLTAAEMITAPEMIDGERGVIVSTASIAAYDGQIGQAAYSASKGGIVSLTLPAAREFSQFGVRVNAIAPGMFRTPLLDGLSEAAKQSLEAAIPYPKRLGEAEEFAKLVVHIVENRYINGEVIRIDGALRMQPR